MGFEPKAEDIDVHGLDISPETLEKLLRVDAEAWKDEIEGIQTFYDKFEWLPKEITNSFDQLKAEISEL